MTGNVSAATARAWRSTRYGVDDPPAMARPARRSAAIDAVLADMGAYRGGFVTAWNPLAQRRPAGWNRRMQQNLIAAARRLALRPGQGVGRGWREDHLLIAGDPRQLAVLARRFRQAGILLVRRGAPARLVFLSPPITGPSTSPPRVPPPSP